MFNPVGAKNFVLGREPVAVGVAGLDAVILAGLALLQVFGWFDFSGEQNAAVVAFVLSVSAFVMKFVRDSVVPVETFNDFQRSALEHADDAYAAGFELGLTTPVPDEYVWFDKPEGS